MWATISHSMFRACWEWSSSEAANDVLGSNKKIYKFRADIWSVLREKHFPVGSRCFYALIGYYQASSPGISQSGELAATGFGLFGPEELSPPRTPLEPWPWTASCSSTGADGDYYEMIYDEDSSSLLFGRTIDASLIFSSSKAAVQ